MNQTEKYGGARCPSKIAKGLEINSSVIVDNPKDVYGCHLEAMEEELLYALRKNDLAWVLKRLEDLKGYLEDENLPRELRKKVLSMIADFDIR